MDDVVDSLICATDYNIKNEVLNIGSGNCYSINYLTQLLGGKRIYIPKRPGEPDKTFADIFKAKSILKMETKKLVLKRSRKDFREYRLLVRCTNLESRRNR